MDMRLSHLPPALFFSQSSHLAAVHLILSLMISATTSVLNYSLSMLGQRKLMAWPLGNVVIVGLYSMHVSLLSSVKWALLSSGSLIQMTDNSVSAGLDQKHCYIEVKVDDGGIFLRYKLKRSCSTDQTSFPLWLVQVLIHHPQSKWFVGLCQYPSPPVQPLE